MKLEETYMNVRFSPILSPLLPFFWYSAVWVFFLSLAAIGRCINLFYQLHEQIVRGPPIFSLWIIHHIYGNTRMVETKHMSCETCGVVQMDSTFKCSSSSCVCTTGKCFWTLFILTVTFFCLLSFRPLKLPLTVLLCAYVSPCVCLSGPPSCVVVLKMHLYVNMIFPVSTYTPLCLWNMCTFVHKCVWFAGSQVHYSVRV